MKQNLNWIVMGVAAFILASPCASMAKSLPDNSKVLIPLSSTADDSVSGSVDFKSSRGRSSMKVQIKNGPSNATLDLIVGGISRGTFTTTSSGSAKLQFQSGSTSGSKMLLDFDPRGEVIEIHDQADDSLFTNDNNDDGSPDGTIANETVNLTSTGVQPGASGHATLKNKQGKQDFSVEIEDVTDGAYDLIVDGVTRGTINVVAGKGEIEFSSSDPGKPLLDFDPFGKVIQVAQNATIILTGTLLASAPGVNVCTPSETTSALTNVGPDPDASGDARLRVRDDCRRDFRVEVEDLPVGDYDLFVGGTNRGTISVAVQIDLSVKGEIEFSTNPDDPGELPLDFDPSGQTIEVKQGATVFLSATAGSSTPGTCDVIDVQPDMTNSGADADAKGKSRFRQDADCRRNFRVEVEKLALGDYDLVVGGITRGTITVQLVNTDALGEIEFDTNPDQPGEILLTFDPRGQVVEVKQGGTLFLSVTMPN